MSAFVNIFWLTVPNGQNMFGKFNFEALQKDELIQNIVNFLIWCNKSLAKSRFWRIRLYNNIYQGAGKRPQPIFFPVSTLC